MTTPPGWQPLTNRGSDEGRNAGLQISPFTRLARTHALGSAADGIIAVALAGSIFFSIDPDAARSRVALYLLCTIAPFAVVTPLIGPAIDRLRGGRRYMLVGSLAIRSLLAFLMISHVDSVLLFPEAFGLLIMQKAYGVAKSAVVPTLVPSSRALVDANSKLALVAALSGLSGGAVGVLFNFIGGPEWAAGIAVLVFALAALHAAMVPAVAVSEEPIDEAERAELRAGSILWAASVVAIMRAIVGFTAFLLAFALRGGSDGVALDGIGSAAGAFSALARGESVTIAQPTEIWRLGVVIAAAGIGALVGARLAPSLRRSIGEERMVLGSLIITVAVAAVAAWIGEPLSAAVLLALAVGIGAATAKLAFDSLVQRDAPAANYGATFARFEARFQLSWVAGAFLPVVLPFGVRAGYLLIVLVGVLSGMSYFLGSRIALRERINTLAQTLSERRAAAADTASAPLPASGPTASGPTASPTHVLQADHVAATPNDPTVIDARVTEQLSLDTELQTDTAKAPASVDAAVEESSWADAGAPYVSSVEGVEFDEPYS